MRGKVVEGIKNLPYNGITPAYAGKRIISGGIPVFTEDHPRLCGEKNGDFW